MSGVHNGYGWGGPKMPLLDALMKVVGSGADSGTLNRTSCECCKQQAGIALVISQRRIARLLVPLVLPILERQAAQSGVPGTGLLNMDHSGTVGELFAWLDEAPPRCCLGAISIRLSGKVIIGGCLIAAFVGDELCAEVRTALKPLGIDLEEPKKGAER